MFILFSRTASDLMLNRMVIYAIRRIAESASHFVLSTEFAPAITNLGQLLFRASGVDTTSPVTIHYVVTCIKTMIQVIGVIHCDLRS
jgi:hypothetical protein